MKVLSFHRLRAWIRKNLKETVLLSFITGPTLRKQNMQAKEVNWVLNHQRRLQVSWRDVDCKAVR